MTSRHVIEELLNAAKFDQIYLLWLQASQRPEDDKTPEARYLTELPVVREIFFKNLAKFLTEEEAAKLRDLIWESPVLRKMFLSSVLQKLIDGVAADMRKRSTSH